MATPPPIVAAVRPFASAVPDPANYCTPARARQASSIHENVGDTETVRTPALSDINPSVPEVELDAFFQHVWPALPGKIDAEFAKIAETAKHNSLLDNPKVKVYQKGRWTAFSSIPAKSTKTENVVFQALVKVAQAIAAAADSFSNERICMFSNCPDNVPSSMWRDNPSRPDGYFILNDRTTTKVHWMYIVAAGEYKKDDGVNETNDDNRKAIWNMHHILREDPRRRFTYAFTVENTTMRLWYGSRSDILVSEAFNIMEEPDCLIRFFLTMMFASASSLGFDTTMEAIADTKLLSTSKAANTQDLPQYKICVGHGKNTAVYRTVDLISSVGTNGIQGRGTRVWKVVRDDKPDGKPAVLKDSWIDSDRKREGDILQELRSEGQTEEQVQSLSVHFLTMIVHGDVYVDGKPDTTLPEEVRATLTGQGERYMLVAPNDARRQRRLKAIQKRPHTGTYHSAQEFRDDLCKKIHTFRTKSRYRIVFEEVCTPLHDETSLCSIFGYLGEACGALKTMHELGWVHRDVSTGNILLHTDPATQHTRVILADLEYAKKMGPTGPRRSDVRTGTADFMAVEVQKEAYIFNLSVDEPRPISDARHTVNGPDQIPFIFNPLHDMEGVVWIGTYFVSNKDAEPVVKHAQIQLPIDITETPGARTGRLHSQLSLSESMFRTGSLRRDIITLRNCFASQAKSLHPSVWPFWSNLEDMRRALVIKYRKAEEDDGTISCNIAQGLHKDFSDRFTDKRLAQLPYDVTLSVLCSPKLSAPTAAPNEAIAAHATTTLRVKRARDDLGDEALDLITSHEDTAHEVPTPIAPGTRKRRRQGPGPAPATTSTRVTRSQTKAAALTVDPGKSKPATRSTRNSNKQSKKEKGKGARAQ